MIHAPPAPSITARSTYAPRHAATMVAEPGGLADLLRLMGAAAGEADRSVDFPAPVRRLHDGDVLFHEGASAAAIYFVRAGTFKVFNTGEDGYEQVLGFVGRGEVLGFDAIGIGAYPNEAVALEESSVYVVLLDDYFGLSPRISALDQVVFRAGSVALERRAELADVMAAVAAEVRLARFLMHLSKRMLACGQSPRRFHLRMSRRDIASYLGVAHETVSRAFSSLMAWGYIRVNNREVEVVDLERLRGFSAGTRRQVEETARQGACAQPAPRSAAMPLMA